MSAVVLQFRRPANDAVVFEGKEQFKARWEASRTDTDIRLMDPSALRAIILALRNGLPATTHRRVLGQLRHGLSGAQLAQNEGGIEAFSNALEIWGRAR